MNPYSFRGAIHKLREEAPRSFAHLWMANQLPCCEKNQRRGRSYAEIRDDSSDFTSPSFVTYGMRNPAQYPSSYLNSISTTFTRPDPNDFFHGGYEDLPVSYFSGLRNPLNRLDDLRNDFIGGNQFDLHLGDEVDLVFSRSINLGMTFLPSEALHFANGHPFDTDSGQGLLHFIQFEWLNNSFDLFH